MAKSGQPSPFALSTPSVSITSVGLAAPNPTRTGLRIVNVSPTATLWVAPIPIVATANGAGSCPIQPLQWLDFENFTNGMNGVYSSGTAAVTVWEWYE